LNKIKKNLIANYSANIFITILILIATPIYINLLGIEKYSMIGLYFTLITIIGVIDTGITTTISREIAFMTSKKNVDGKICSTYFSYEVIYWSILIFLGSLLIFWFIFFDDNFFETTINQREFNISFILICLTIIFQLPSNFYIGGLMGLQKQVLASKILSFFYFFRIFFSLIIVSITNDLRVFFLSFLIISIVQTIFSRVYIWKNLKKYSTNVYFSVNLIKNVKNFAIGITIITAASILTSNLDKLYVSKYFSFEILGFYFLAWTIASGLFRFGIPIMQTFNPHFAELFSVNKFKELDSKFKLSNKLIFLLIVPISITIGFNSELVLFLWTKNYIVAENTSKILFHLIIGSMFTICAYPSLSLLYSQKKFRSVLLFHILGLICMFVLFHFFAKHYDLSFIYSSVAIYGIVFFIYVFFSIIFLNQIKKIYYLLAYFIYCVSLSIIINYFVRIFYSSDNYLINVFLLVLNLILIKIFIILITKEFKLIIKENITNLFFKNKNAQN